MRSTTIVEIIAFLFIILFLYTGISKLMDYSVFKEQIATSPILAPISAWIAIVVPAAEIILSIVLFIPKWRVKGLYVSLIVMIIFTGYIIAILSLNENIPCSCGGVLELLTWEQHIVFNITFIVLGIIGIVLAKKDGKKNETNLFQNGHRLSIPK